MTLSDFVTGMNHPLARLLGAAVLQGCRVADIEPSDGALSVFTQFDGSFCTPI